MLFKRKLYQKLLKWKEISAGSSALLIEGARRIGKSTIVEEFAKAEYDDYMLLDFARESTDIKDNFINNIKFIYFVPDFIFVFSIYIFKYCQINI